MAASVAVCSHLQWKGVHAFDPMAWMGSMQWIPCIGLDDMPRIICTEWGSIDCMPRIIWAVMFGFHGVDEMAFIAQHAVIGAECSELN